MKKANFKPMEISAEQRPAVAVDATTVAYGEYPPANDENNCVVCFKNVEIYSIGDCDHPVCYECSTRMRVVCEQNECPICRNILVKVIFTNEKLPFRELEAKNRSQLYIKRYGIAFVSREIQSKYFKLLEHPCPMCDAKPFRTFNGLAAHVQKRHNRRFCQFCVDHLKIFTAEHRCYTSEELKVHEASGDADNRSHRGHPLCEYCKKRFLDRDDLFRHLRHDHYYCHFCEADGTNEFYKDYTELAEHFRKEHFLCEKGDCVKERFVCAFRSEIDFKAHVANVHGHSLSKWEARQARTVQMQLRRGPRDCNEQIEETRMVEDHRQLNQPEPSNADAAFMDQEFPALAGASAPNVVLAQPMPLHLRNMNRASGLVRTAENFPALGNEQSSSSSSTSKNANGKPMSALLRHSNGVILGSSSHYSAPNNTVQKVVKASVNPKAAVVTEQNKPTDTSQFPSLPSSSTTKPNGSASRSSDFWTVSAPSTIKPSTSNITAAHKRAPTSSNDFPELPTTSKAITKPKANHFLEEANSAGKLFQIARSTSVSSMASSATKKSAPIVNNAPQKKPSCVVDFPALPVAARVLVPAKTLTRPVSNGTAKTSLQRILQAEGAAKKSKAPDVPRLPAAVKTKKVAAAKNFDEDALPSTLDETHIASVSAKHRPLIDDYVSAVNTTILQKLQLVQKEEAKPTNNTKKAPKLDTSNFPTLKNGGASPVPAIPTTTWVNHPLNERKLRELDNRKAKIAEAPDLTSNKAKNNKEQQKRVQKSIAVMESNPLETTNHTTSTGNKDSVSDKHPISGCNYNNKKTTPPGLAGKSVEPTCYYSPPPNSASRNQYLAEYLTEVFEDNAILNEFRRYSQSFREGITNPQSYYEHCRAALGDKFNIAFPELLALLPDIAKQQELLAAHLEYITGARAHLSSEDNHEQPRFTQCHKCSQVLIPDDVDSHMLTHELLTQFPSLGSK